MTFQERVEAVAGLRFSQRHARFLVTVALHSGYCLRRHYETFAGVRYGKNVRAFLDGLVTRGVADRFVVRADRGHVYHVRGRALYRAIGEDEHRHRRRVGPALMGRRLMALDAVLARPDVAWFATTDDKVELLASQFGIPAHALSARVAAHHLPVFVAGERAVPHFVYLATDGHPEPFATFLRDHALLFRCLSQWVVVAVGVSPPPSLRRVFGDFVGSLSSSMPSGYEDLRWYFERRRLVDGGELAQVSVFDLRRFRDLRQRFGTPVHEALYAEWAQTGRIGAATPESRTGDSNGTLLLEALPFTYEQFGSLPGVA
jgi:hypothetical protein